MSLPDPIIDRDEDETVYEGGCLCVFCKANAALPEDDLCEDCCAEVVGEILLARIEEQAA